MNAYTIVGPGAVGTFLACRLHGAGYRVRVVDHRPWRARMLARKGFGIRGEGKDITCRIPVSCNTAAGDAGTIFLVCVKAYAFRELLEKESPRLARGKAVVVVQNGLGWPEECRAFLPAETCGGGIAYFGVTSVAPGTVRPAGSGHLLLGPVSASSSVAWDAIAEDLRRAGMEAHALSFSRMREEMWMKFLVNTAINPLTVLFDCTNGELLDGHGRENMLERVVREGVKVARACGIRIGEKDAVKAAKETCRNTAANVSSMLQDVRAGRPTELDALTGILIRRAAAHGIPVPASKGLHAETAKISLASREKR